MSKQVSAEEIRNLLRNVAPDALTNAEIRDALDYTKDDTHIISATVSTLVRRPRNKVFKTMKGDKVAWYSRLREEKAA